MTDCRGSRYCRSEEKVREESCHHGRGDYVREPRYGRNESEEDPDVVMYSLGMLFRHCDALKSVLGLLVIFLGY
jgi:hypothetical protein